MPDRAASNASGYNVLSSGTPSGVNIENRRSLEAPSEERGSQQPYGVASHTGSQSARTTGVQSAGYNALESDRHQASTSTTDRAAKAAVSAAAGTAAYQAVKSDRHSGQPSSTQESGPYQQLSSGTPSRVRASDNNISAGSSVDPTFAQQSQQQQQPYDRSRDFASTEATASHHQYQKATHHSDRHRTPYTTHEDQTQAAHGDRTNLPGGQQHHSGNAQDPALAASVAAWSASNTHEREPQAQGPRPVVHSCQNCGAANDISHYFTKEGLASFGRE